MKVIKALIKLVLLPFTLLYKLSRFIISLIGKILTLLLGLVFIIVGVFLLMSVVGFFPGVALIIFGLSFVISSILK